MLRLQRAIVFLIPRRTRLLCDERDAGLVGGGDDGGGVEEQRTAGIDGEAGGAGAGHGFDGGEADDGDVEAHVLLGLGDLDDGEGAAEGGGGLVEAAHQRAGALDGGVGAFHGFDGDAGLGGDDDGLAEVEAARPRARVRP